MAIKERLLGNQTLWYVRCDQCGWQSEPFDSQRSAQYAQMRHDSRCGEPTGADIRY